jgi:hypothetical protein
VFSYRPVSFNTRTSSPTPWSTRAIIAAWTDISAASCSRRGPSSVSQSGPRPVGGGKGCVAGSMSRIATCRR